jgi:hypothetical protein
VIIDPANKSIKRFWKEGMICLSYNVQHEYMDIIQETSHGNRTRVLVNTLLTFRRLSTTITIQERRYIGAFLAFYANLAGVE